MLGNLGCLEVSILSSMNDPKFQQHGGVPAAEHPPHRSRWKRVHHSPFFWVAVVCIMLAMSVYVATNNLSSRPGKKAQQPIPALAP